VSSPAPSSTADELTDGQLPEMPFMQIGVAALSDRAPVHSWKYFDRRMVMRPHSLQNLFLGLRKHCRK
jgi:hypothetical protein